MMLDEELPVIPRRRSPGALPDEEKKSFHGYSACCEAERTLARLYGDQSKARERCLQVCTQAKKIDEEELTTEIKVFRAVADLTRLRILKLLAGGELCISEIMLALKKPQSSISHNLSILEDAGLIKERKQGKWCHYEISDGAVMDMVNFARRFKRI
ncbi:Putative arsenical resistance operon repressor ArsR [uncultured archaeon]|nr:Putative arsenical resistance operon repressor ArsR [uncultured archaeon]